MQTQYTYKLNPNRKIVYNSVILSLIILITLNIFSDYFFAQIQNTGFYLSESVLFSSFWIILPPILYLQWQLTHKIKNNALNILLAVGMVLLHVFAYPLLVTGLSHFFYNHSFAYMQTLNYGITAYFIPLVIIYGVSLAGYLFFKKNMHKSQEPHTTLTEVAAMPGETGYISSIVVTDHDNKKIILQVNDIYCIAASTPYVTIHHCSKKYLHTTTLKSLENQLNSNLFVRIHKSGIVNISKVINYQSRQNGDYDITLSNNNQLRVSRVYAKNFMQKLEAGHRLTIK